MVRQSGEALTLKGRQRGHEALTAQFTVSERSAPDSEPRACLTSAFDLVPLPERNKHTFRSEPESRPFASWFLLALLRSARLLLSSAPPRLA